MLNLKHISEAKQSKLAEIVKIWDEIEQTPKEKARPNPERIENYQIREANRINWAEINDIDLSTFIERKIGTTFDTTYYPPNPVAQKVGKSVAMIHNSNDDKRPPIGFATGFMIAENLLITNHHVFPDASTARGCAANFMFEYNSSKELNFGTSFELNPDRFFITNSNLDFAIVFVESNPLKGKNLLSDFSYINLISTRGKIIENEPINLVQHPNGEAKQYTSKNNNLFKIDDTKGILFYEADTKQGSSGSPVFNKYWETVAVHFTGVPMRKNGKIITLNNTIWDGENEEDVMWIANAGKSISKIIEYLNQVQVDTPSKDALLKNLLGGAKDPLLESSLITKPITNIGSSKNSLAMSNIIFNLNGVTTVNININQTSGVPSGIQTEEIKKELNIQSSDTDVLEKSLKFDTNYENREGYNPDFLEGIKIDFPTVDEEKIKELVKNEDGKVYILPYHHFSLVMNKSRRLMMWSAVNVDYDESKRFKDIFPKRASFGSDKWILDERIPTQYQITDNELYKPAKKVDRGHIVRREDNAWGNNPTEVEYANSDTYHWTNCTPQHEGFNQANADGYEKFFGVWGKLENQIQKVLNSTNKKAIIFAGPYLADDDDEIAFNTKKIKVPNKFWKVVAAIDSDGKMKCFGFWLDQTDVVEKYGFGVEKLDMENFKTYQLPIKEISKRTGVNFDKIVYSKDVKKSEFNESTKIVGKLIENLEDIEFETAVL